MTLNLGVFGENDAISVVALLLVSGRFTCLAISSYLIRDIKKNINYPDYPHYRMKNMLGDPNIFYIFLSILSAFLYLNYEISLIILPLTVIQIFIIMRYRGLFIVLRPSKSSDQPTVLAKEPGILYGVLALEALLILGMMLA